MDSHSLVYRLLLYLKNFLVRRYCQAEIIALAMQLIAVLLEMFAEINDPESSNYFKTDSVKDEKGILIAVSESATSGFCNLLCK